MNIKKFFELFWNNPKKELFRFVFLSFFPHPISFSQVKKIYALCSLLMQKEAFFPEWIPSFAAFQKQCLCDRLIPNRPVIGFYYPSSAYRGHLGTIRKKLRKQGYNVILFIGTLCRDAYEREPWVYYAGHNIIDFMDFVDVFVCATLMDCLPKNSKKIIFNHDIHDSPADNIEFSLSLIKRFDYFFLPSKSAAQFHVSLLSKFKDSLPSNESQLFSFHLIKGGYPKFDKNIEYFSHYKGPVDSLIYAPTVIDTDFSDIVSIPNYGKKVVEVLLKNFPDFKIIFRPHPHSLKYPVVQEIFDLFAHHANFVADKNGSFYMENYARSALMITDISGTAFTYAFTTLRPVVFFSPYEELVQKKYSSYSYVEDRKHLGLIALSLEEIRDRVKLLLDKAPSYTDRIRDFREVSVFNPGTSEDYFLKCIPHIINNSRLEDWVIV